MVLTNTVVTNVRTSINSYINTNFTYFAVGTGSGAASTSETSLESETFQKAIQDTTNLTTSFIVSGYMTALENNSLLINEIGYKTGSGGTLLQRAVLTSPISKTNSKEVWIDLEIKNSITQG